MHRKFDAIIIGAGQAGPPLAGRLTDVGMTVALVERGPVGGTCVNTGCTPTKAMVASAKIAHSVAHAAEHGVHIPSAAKIDFPAILERALGISAKSRTGLEDWLGSMDGLTLLRGQARFVDAETIRVGEDTIGADRVFLNVGARANNPDLPGLDQIDALTSADMFSLRALPEHLVIVGGSYIGLEFAQMFRRFGSRVTVIEKSGHLASREDNDVSDAIRDILEAEDIDVRTNAECIRFSRSGDGRPAVSVSCKEGAPEIVGSHVLLALGRRPNTDELGLEAAGVACGERGYVSVNDQLETNVPGIWALGDCNGHGAFTHTSYNDYEIVAANLLDGGDRKVSDRISTYGLFIDPPLGRAGLSEAEAIEKGHKVLVGKRPMTRVSRAVEKGETQGLMKIVVDAESRAILGGAILGPGGDEAIHAIVDMMHLGANADDLTRVMHIHPTVSELLPTIAGELETHPS
ncbi:FAD-containing oxidoreductase [Devosia sp. CAU 1758]